MMMPYEMVDGEEATKEQVCVPDYKSLLCYVADTKPIKRAQMVFNDYERVLRTKLDWYISEEELASSSDKVAVSLLGSIFYWNS